MKKAKIATLLAFTFMAIQQVSAQHFLQPSESFSPKKISYLTMKDGSTMEVYLKSYKREKGLIKEMKVEDKEGKKVKIKPEDIQYMYLPQSGFDKLSKELDYLHDVQQWDNDEIDQSKVADGYIYFEQAEVKVKNEKKTLMMQLLNPSFSSKIRVYHDPNANETGSISMSGFTVAGGEDRSYYIAVQGNTAFKLTKRDYDEQFVKIFGICPALKEKFEKVKWTQFDEHVYEHNRNCK